MKQTGRPPNAIKDLCREFVFNDKLIEKLSTIAKTAPQQRDRLRAIEILLDRSYGKPEQELGITQRDDTDRPTTETLIQTIAALRAELDNLRKGSELEKAE